uniref:Uncharacterized protein n=1 Tax=Vespula pensylvanica TaxID=30213 RepID=A0A834NIK1_VESPE|nr:hypothetical protein H0235_013981 [Vespula pensylvanica]
MKSESREFEGIWLKIESLSPGVELVLGIFLLGIKRISEGKKSGKEGREGKKISKGCQARQSIKLVGWLNHT